jgi:hypothetical protein
MEKLLQNAISAYMPKIEVIAEVRRKEMTDLKSKIREEPEKVEGWFNKEIEELGTMNIPDMTNKLQ